MAKKLNEISKAFATIQKKVDGVTDDCIKLNTNFWQHCGMLFEGVDAINERIVELKSKGGTGNTVGDFADDKDVKAFLKGVEDCKTFCKKESDQYYAEFAKLKTYVSDLEKLAKDTDAIVKARKFKVSKSKGALKDVAAAIKKFAVEVQKVIDYEPGPHPSSYGAFK